MRCTLARPRCLLNLLVMSRACHVKCLDVFGMKLTLRGPLAESLGCLNHSKPAPIILQKTNFHESGLLTLQVWIVIYYDS